MIVVIDNHFSQYNYKKNIMSICYYKDYEIEYFIYITDAI